MLSLCRRPESNRHEVTLTAPSRLRVYQFHHFGIIKDKHSKIKLFFKYTPHQCGTALGLNFCDIMINNYKKLYKTEGTVCEDIYVCFFKTAFLPVPPLRQWSDKSI